MTRCPRWEKRGWKQIMSSLFFERRSAAIFLLVVLVALLPLGDLYAQEPKMLVRISGIEIFNQHLEEYQRILNEEAEASMRLEPGVLCIFPTAQKDNPTLIRTPPIQVGQFIRTNQVPGSELVGLSFVFRAIVWVQ